MHDTICRGAFKNRPDRSTLPSISEPAPCTSWNSQLLATGLLPVTVFTDRRYVPSLLTQTSVVVSHFFPSICLRSAYRIIRQQSSIVIQNKPPILPTFHDVSPFAQRSFHDGRHLYAWPQFRGEEQMRRKKQRFCVITRSRVCSWSSGGIITIVMSFISYFFTVWFVV